MMEIKLNGAARTVAPGTSIKALLAELGINERGCAVELNQNIVKKNSYSETLLSKGDIVEIVHFVGGG